MKPLLLLITALSCSLLSMSQKTSDKLEKLSNNVATIESGYNKRQMAVLDSIKDINKEIQTLKSSPNLTKRIEALEKKQESMEQLERIRESKAAALLRVRYEAGLLVIKDILELLKTLKSQYAALNFQQSYNDLSNPNSYPDYTKNIEYLKKKLAKSAFSLPELTISNVFLNIAYSCARGLMSAQPDKDSKVAELTCILDFSSRVSTELGQINGDLKYLQLILDKMLINYQELFANYSSVVGYRKTFDDYISNPDDDMPDLIKNYFDKLAKKEITEKEKDMKSVSFQVRKIADSYLEYEIYIRQGLAYYEKFDIVLDGLQPKCGVAAIKEKMMIEYDKVRKNLKTAKTSFEQAYKGKIKQSYIKQLSEG